MYNKGVIDRLVSIIEKNDGIGDKQKLADIVAKEFDMVLDRKVYYCDDFAIRFSKSEKVKMSNTVLSLSALQKYDNAPFIVCIVSSAKNHLLLANTSFLKKISHSSKELRMDNIKGSFNGGDIIFEFNGLDNTPENFEDLFAYHTGVSFQDNLERLVEATNGIVGRVHQFEVTPSNRGMIMNSISRAQSFIKSENYLQLEKDLSDRVNKVRGEIAIAAFIDNVNVRGRVIEYLITDDGSTLKDQIMLALKNKQPLPKFKTDDNLGDYSKVFPNYNTETDIKTKVLFLDGNPKAYNIDKLLEFLSTEKSVYMIYLVGIDDDGSIVVRLCSGLDRRLISATNIVHHWAGRNSRGVAQFIGKALEDILLDENFTTKVEDLVANRFLDKLINLGVDTYEHDYEQRLSYAAEKSDI